MGTAESASGGTIAAMTTSAPAPAPAALEGTLDQLLKDIRRVSEEVNRGTHGRVEAAQAALLLSQAYARLVAPEAPQAALLPDASTTLTQTGLLNRG